MITLKLGDATQSLFYPADPVDLILFDPPYVPLIHTYEQRNHHKDKVTGKWVPPAHQLESIPTPVIEDYPAFWRMVCWECMKRLKPTGWFIFKADDFTNNELYPITKEYFNFFRKSPCWDKKMFGIGTGIRNQHENLIIYRPIDFEHSYFADRTGFSSVQYYELPEESLMKMVGDVVAPNFNRGRFGKIKQQDHINQTPPQIWEPYLTQFCPPDGLVLDPTMGSGSVGLALKHLNRLHHYTRSYWGIELTQTSYDMAQTSLNPNTILTDLIL